MQTPETPREIAARHVREGEARLAKQERLAASIDRAAFPKLATDADRLTNAFRDTLRLWREDLERLRAGGD